MMRRIGFVSSAGTSIGSSSFTARCVVTKSRPIWQSQGQKRRCWAPVMQRTQQDTPWNLVKVTDNKEAAEDHRLITCEVGVTDAVGSLVDSFRIPGQYVQIRLPGEEKPGFYAISGPPNVQGLFEFLVKKSPGSQTFCDTKPGDMVEMSPVGGPGFPTKVRLLGTPNILLFATGSGIAPIRAAIESPINGVFEFERRSVKLYYGCRYPERMSYQDRFPQWTQLGVEVIPVMSQPGPDWTGRTGYVQDALKADGVQNAYDTGVLLCGVKGMATDVREYLVSQGVQDDKILTNF